MPAPLYPAAAWNPGVNAGYNAGRSQMRYAVCHYTVGRDSTGIGVRGYFHWLVARDGTVQQFAEADAIAWHAGEHNGYGPGIEVEYLPGEDDAVFTDPQRAACGALVRWLNSEWGVLLVYHDGDHDIAPGTYAGFVSHKALIQSEPHQDYWPQSDWDLMVGDEDDDMKAFIVLDPDPPRLKQWLCRDGIRSWIPDEGVRAKLLEGGAVDAIELPAGQARNFLSMFRELDAPIAVSVTVSGAVSGTAVDTGVIADAVAAELATRLQS